MITKKHDSSTHYALGPVDNNLRPIIPHRIKIKHSILNGLSSSPRYIMPYAAVPTDPIPTQTAYAVPIGNVLVASESRYMLSEMKIMQKHVGPNRVKPFVLGIAAA